jgi:hypothetical protein
VATRQRLTVPRLTSELPLLHLAIGVAMVVIVVMRPPVEGDPLPTYLIAQRIAEGLIPYRDFPVEYPPLALPAIVLPRLVAGTSENLYEWIFTFMSIGFAVATAAVVYWLARRGWSATSTRTSLLMFAGLVLAGAPLVIWRFDIVPALFSALALAAFSAKRDGWTGVALGLGTLAKLYPAFLGPVFFGVRLMERRWRSAAALVIGAGVTTALAVAVMLAVAGRDAFSFLFYQDERGVEIESVAGGLALLADAFALAPARIFFDFGAWQVESSVIARLELPMALFNAALVVALVGSAFWHFRADVRTTGWVAPLTVVRYLVATLLVVILINKVLSPQYMVWLMPFAALLRPRQALLLVVAVALTTLIYPMGFQGLLDTDPAVVVALNVRNLLLFVMFVWLAWPAHGHASDRGDVRQAADQPGTDPEDQYDHRKPPVALRDQQGEACGEGHGHDLGEGQAGKSNRFSNQHDDGVGLGRHPVTIDHHQEGEVVEGVGQG